jgi:hypothetical protein
MEETPTMSKVKVLLSGVKMTSNKLAVKLELLWQELSDFDSIKRMAEAPDRNVRRAVTKTKGDSIEDRMTGDVSTKAVAARTISLVMFPSFLINWSQLNCWPVELK